MQLSDDDGDAPEPEPLEGKLIQGSQWSEVIQHTRKKCISLLEVPLQVQKNFLDPVAHPLAINCFYIRQWKILCMTKEWQDIDKTSFTRF